MRSSFCSSSDIPIRYVVFQIKAGVPVGSVDASSSPCLSLRHCRDAGELICSGAQDQRDLSTIETKASGYAGRRDSGNIWPLLLLDGARPFRGPVSCEASRDASCGLRSPTRREAYQNPVQKDAS
eukprot:scaffold1298_cov257-Pinguiococcus_pyrenoidosus.AAC.10